MQKPKSFRPRQPGQTTSRTPSPRVCLTKDHQVYFLLDLEELDLSEILNPAQAKDPRGEKGFDTRMMTILTPIHVGNSGPLLGSKEPVSTHCWPRNH